MYNHYVATACLMCIFSYSLSYVKSIIDYEVFNDHSYFILDFMFIIKRDVLSTHHTWITPINGLVVDFCLQWVTF